MEDGEKQIRNELSKHYLNITKENVFMFDNIDSFVALSRDNTSVKDVMLYPFDDDAGDYDFWDKAGQIVGNLMELQAVNIFFLPYKKYDDDYDAEDDDSVDVSMPDLEILNRILLYLRRKIMLSSETEDYDTKVEEIEGLARAIHGHPMISRFSSEMQFTSENLGPWCSALATLPSLEDVTFGFKEPQAERDSVYLEPLVELLRRPALRFAGFHGFYFTDALCHATANALEEGSSIINIMLDESCSFPDGGRAIIANALKRNASVTDIEFAEFDEPLCNTLAAVLLSNSTLQNLRFHMARSASGNWLSSILLSLGMNTTLKSLDVPIFDKFGDELCTAIMNGLAKNSTLETLSLNDMVATDDDGAVSARDALSFLRTNSTLKALTVSFVPAATAEKESYISAFQLEAVTMLEENHCLEDLTIVATDWHITFQELLALVSALKCNTTLKILCFQRPFFESDYLSIDEVKQLVSILSKNYGLEDLRSESSCVDDETVKAILRLNRAGRRYLIEDGSSVSKGVDVLSAVNDDIDCVFFHLLENPGLCSRRAVDDTTRSQRPGTNLDESSSSGKRERAQSQTGKEVRRRLS
jgi:hypothetical protein